jgi:hypothetical protein
LSYGAVGEEVIASLLAQARSDSRAEWQAAVGQLALRSVSEPLAMQAWSELMLSFHPEMRLRGVHGLRNLASGQPDQVENFLRQRFEEEETFADPVLSQVLVQLLGSLPPQMQDRLFDELVDRGEEARCAAVSVLWNRALTQGPDLLLKWSQDGSPRVRTHLALHLCEKMPSSQAFEPLLRLARDTEFEVRTAVAMGMADLQASAQQNVRQSLDLNPEFRQLQRTLLEQPEVLKVQLQAAGQFVPGEHPLNSILHLTRDLEKRPYTALQELTPWVRLAGSWHRLKTVADFARDPQVAWAARALSQLCRVGDPVERVLGCLGALQEGGTNPVLQEFAQMCKCCVELLDVSDVSGLRTWGQRYRRERAAGRRDLRWSDFEQLAEALDNPHPALAAVSKLLDTSGMGPLPERELIEPALVHVEQVLSEQRPTSPKIED